MQRRQIVRRYSTPPVCTAQGATRRHFAIRSQGRARSARYKDGSSGGAASNNLYFYVHKVDAQGRDSTFAPSPQTYATAAFGEGRVREGANLLWLRCQATDSSEQSQRASCEPLTAVAEREDQAPSTLPCLKPAAVAIQQRRLGCRPDRI